jgi:hypothetical protein
VPGIDEPLSAENATDYLLIDQYVQYAGSADERREVLGDVAQAVFDALTSRPLPGLRQLTDVLGPAVAGGHLRIASLGGDAERAFLESSGIDGAFARAPGDDLVSVRSSNASESKIDVWLHRSVELDTTYDPRSGRVSTTVTVTVRNDAPPDGFPDYLIGNSFDLPEGTSRHQLTLYTPLSLQAATLNGSATGASRRTELGVDAYTVITDIPAGGQSVLTFQLTGTIDPGPDYRLDVLPQPLVNPDQLLDKVRRSDADTSPEPVYSGTILEPLHLRVDVG